jgi:hypothetical protein
MHHTVFIWTQHFGNWILSPSSGGTWAKLTELVPVVRRQELSSVDWAQLSRYHLKTETESSLRNVLFK